MGKMTGNGEFVQVITTCATRAEAEQIAAALVEGRLAGCAQIEGPIESVYRWQGAVERAEEWRLAIKTTHARFAAVAQAIRQRHSYDLPEIMALPIVEASVGYAAWLREQVESP
jgi:periplasmic divalent cation tolerance protein